MIFCSFQYFFRTKNSWKRTTVLMILTVPAVTNSEWLESWATEQWTSVFKAFLKLVLSKDLTSEEFVLAVAAEAQAAHQQHPRKRSLCCTLCFHRKNLSKVGTVHSLFVCMYVCFSGRMNRLSVPVDIRGICSCSRRRSSSCTSAASAEAFPMLHTVLSQKKS